MTYTDLGSIPNPYNGVIERLLITLVTSSATLSSPLQLNYVRPLSLQILLSCFSFTNRVDDVASVGGDV